MDYQNINKSQAVVETFGNKLRVDIQGKNSEKYSISNLRADMNKSGQIKRYSVDIHCIYNSQSDTIVSRNIDTFRKKINRRLDKWEKAYRKQKNKDKAKKLTQRAQNTLNYLNNILKSTIKLNNSFDVLSLKKHNKFKKPKPKEPNYNNVFELPEKPKKSDFSPHFSILDLFSKNRRLQKIIDYKKRYKQSLIDWKNKVAQTENKNKQILIKNAKIREEWQKEIDKWESNLINS